MKNKQKKGISLIVLVITIIVMIVLAAAIILSVSSGKVISKSSWAKLSSDRASLQSEYSVILTDMLNDGTDGNVYTGLSIEDVRNNEKFKEWCRKVEAVGSQFTVYGDDELEVTKPSEVEVRVKLTNEQIEEYGLTMANGKVNTYDWIYVQETNIAYENDSEMAYVYKDGIWQDVPIEKGGYVEGEFAVKFYEQDEMVDLTEFGLKNAKGYHMVIDGNGEMGRVIDTENMVASAWAKQAGEWLVEMEMNGSSTKDPGIYFYITKVTLSEGITKIPDEFFYNSFVNEVVMPDSLTSIGKGAFERCYNLKHVTIPDNVTTIGDQAFYFSGLQSIKLPTSLKSIGNRAFEECRNITEITLPEGLISIGDYGLYGCEITNITLPDSLTSIGTEAFGDCIYLKEITLPNNMTSISQSTFSNCYNLISVRIPKNITSIGVNAFGNCEKLTDVYYEGTAEDWNKIVIEEANEYLTSATIHYNCN